MKPFVWLLVAIVVLYFVVVAMTRERFQPEFLDKTQVDRTVAMENSSYFQATNHYVPAPANMGPIDGMATPFQVNQWKSYVPV
jgi:hypothetical protein